MASSTTTTRVRRFTRSEYERMAAQGIFGPEERIELVEGEILVMTPQGSRHTTVLHIFARALEKTLGEDHYVRIQSPLTVSQISEPEPDVAVVVGTPDDFLREHPTTALLVVEVSDSTLALDRRKAAVYAEAGIQEYWIANLVDGVLEVHRSPRESAKGVWSYASIKRLKPTGSVQPLAAPSVKLKVSDLLR